MANFKALAKDTAIYGVSSIVGRFLNYLLVPLSTFWSPYIPIRLRPPAADMGW